jgi:hypothetical protein
MKNLWIVITLISFQLKSQQIDLSIIAKIESSGNVRAINLKDGGSRGIYQIHPVCLADYNKLNNTKIKPDSLFIKDINEKIAKWMFEVRIPQLLRHYGYKVTTYNKLVSYNAGITYVIYKKKIPKSTLSYIEKYNNFKKHMK